MVKHEGLWPKANGLSITAKIVTDDDGDDDNGDDVCDDDIVFVDDGSMRTYVCTSSISGISALSFPRSFRELATPPTTSVTLQN